MIDARAIFYDKLQARESKFRFFTQGLEIDDLSRYDIELVLDDEGFVGYTPGRLPYLTIKPSICRLKKEVREDHPDFGEYVVKPMHYTGIFGAPGKMGCFAFSLPAGPLNYHGTCPSAGYNIDDPLFICNGCYALGGRYINSDYILSSQITLEWTKRCLANGTFVQNMVALLENLWYDKTEKAQTITFRKKIKGRKKKVKKPIWFGTDKYFRLHDSGDFFSSQYFYAWTQICRRFPRTLFWAPTRVPLNPDESVKEKWADILRDAPPNLRIRPSTLFFESQPPVIPGLAAGSMCSVKKQKGVRSCPVYWRDDVDTCTEARCRRCWTSPQTQVNYPAHGDDARRIYKEVYGEETAKQIKGVDELGAIVAPYPAAGETWGELEDDADRSFLVGPSKRKPRRKKFYPTKWAVELRPCQNPAKIRIPDATIDNPPKVANAAADIIMGREGETPGIESALFLFLDTHNKLLNLWRIDGTINEAVIYPREIFQRALAAGAAGFVMVHNHPSGQRDPSAADMALVRKVFRGAKELDLVFHDSIIITIHDGGIVQYTSMRENGLMPTK
jgi:hypothetical protein